MRRRTLVFIPLAMSALGPYTARAHGVDAGQLRIDHPYATPSRMDEHAGTVYFRAIRNEGATADRLLSAASPIAGAVSIHRVHQESGVMLTRAVPALDLPAGVELKMRHNTTGGYCLRLLDLKAPLETGDRFALTLTFEHAGSHEVRVWVQTPRTDK